MDISYLKKLNPTLKFAKTKSLFFNKYLYKVKIFAPAIRAHIYFKGDMLKIIQREQRLLQGLMNSHNSVWKKSYKIDHGFNNFLYKKFKTGKMPHKRIEFPIISIYFENEDQLKCLIDDMINLSFIGHLCELTFPDQHTTKDLTNDTVLVKKIDSKYKFKVQLKGGISDQYLEQRQSLMSYLYGLGDQIHKASYKTTSSTFRYYYYPTYFYCTDDKILFFLKLAYPDLIGKTFKVLKV